LGGWFLTDDSRNLAKWRFGTNVTINANGYLVVFASGKNRSTDASHLHSNFQLATEGEYLALVDAKTNIVSELAPAFPPQTFGVSYGRIRGTAGQYGYFTTPTPKAVNADSGQGFAPGVDFSRPSGTFVANAPFQLTLSTPLTNATIYYAVGTNLPGTNSLRYTNSFLVSTSAIVRARAYAPGLLPGPIATRFYICLASQTNIVNFKSDLPIMILHNFGRGTVPSGSYQYVVMETFEPRGGVSSMLNTPDLAVEAGFHLRGSSTLGYAKGSFRLEVHDAYGNDQGVDLLGLPKDADWVLYAPNNFEPALFHNPLAHQLLRDMGYYGSRTRFVEVYLKDDTGAPGAISSTDYNGIYVLEERIKISNDRVDIPYPEPQDVAPPEVTGGYLWAIDRSNGQPTFNCTAGSFQWVDPSGTEMANTARKPQIDYLTKYFNDFSTALNNNATWTNPVTGYAAYIDVTNWVDFHIHEVATYNVDGFRLSGFFYKPRNGKLRQGPSWDYDRTQGSTDGRDFNPRTYRSTCGDLGTDFYNPSANGVPWWDRLFRAPDFWQTYIDRYQELRQGSLSLSNINSRIDMFATQLRQAQPREQAKWSVAPRSGTGSACGYSYNFGTGQGFQSEVNWKKVWYSNRLDFMDTNFLGRPSLGSPGGRVTNGFTVSLTDNSKKTNTFLYYTLDGADPRASGGSIRSNALLYNGPIVLSNNARVFARAYNNKHRNLTGANNPPTNSFWSGNVAATYYLDLPALRITELMFHPPPMANNTNDANNFEFLEVKNTGASPLNLVRAQLQGGIQFSFPNLTLAPGQSCVVVANTNAFALRYGTNNPNILVAGQYTGNLGNGGDHLVLVGPLGEPILDFYYNDWYRTTDGTGFSLVIANETLPPSAWGDQQSWRPSRELGGSPGQANPAPPAIAPMVVNELLTHTDPPACDAVELYNPTTAAVDLSGWFLTDDFNSPLQYRIPAGTTIAAGGYLVFYSTNSFGQTNPPSATSFQFSAHGEEVYLFSGGAATTNLTGYVHGFDFGAQFNGATFGRYVTTSGKEVFVSQIRPTLGGPNAGPRVGPVVLSEIMYYPPDVLTNGVAVDNSQDEYIELMNITGEDVPLYDPVYRTNNWRLQDAVDYVFPTNVVIPSGGRVLVVNFDPANSAQAEAFRQTYSVPAGVPLFGPYGGKLNNDSDVIELMRPDQPEPPTQPDAGTVPYVLVERISYSSQAPWPTNGIGLGAALQRLDVEAYGNEPANWVAAGSTAGAGFAPCTTLPTITQQPANQVAVGYRNNTARFTVAATGPGDLKYQWFWNDLPIQGGTAPTLEVTDVTPEDAGAYRALVFNCAGTVASSNAMLAVLMPLMISAQPTNAIVRTNGSASFSVTVVSITNKIAYQWRFNGTDLPKATNKNYSVTNATLAKDGLYQVLASDAISSELSQPARLYFLINPTIVSGPQSQFVPVGSRVDLSVQVDPNATLPVFYRLRRNAGILTNFTLNDRAMTFSFTNAVLTNSATYYFGVTNMAKVSETYSPTAYVAVVVLPTNVAVMAGTDAAFTVVVGNPGITTRPTPMDFQWQYNGVPLSNVPNLGAIWSTTSITVTNANVLITTNRLLLEGVQAGDAGSYGLQATILTNVPIAPALFAATLQVITQDRDGDGLPDDWELAHGLNPNDARDALADADGDGMSNLAEYQAGTDPQDPKSYLKVQLVAAPGATNVVLSFGAAANKTYSVLYQNPLTTGGAWTSLTNLAGAPTNRTVTVSDPSPSAPARYYRVRTP
jgi:hypothetical protein